MAESRRQALATTSRGNTFPLARGDAAARRAAVRTLSAPVPSPAGSAGGGAPPGPEAAGGAQPTAQPDPFRVNVPASAFQLEERRSGQGDQQSLRSCLLPAAATRNDGLPTTLSTVAALLIGSARREGRETCECYDVAFLCIRHTCLDSHLSVFNIMMIPWGWGLLK